MYALIYLRFHNFIAEELSKINPIWDDEKLFQESRRILIAVHQNLIFNQWVPIILGRMHFF